MTFPRSLLLTLALVPALLLAACTDDTAEPVVEGPMVTEPVERNDLAAAAAEAGLTTLTDALEAAGLTETLQGEGPYTLFAPTNEAFASLPGGTLDTLLAEGNRDRLRAILEYHVVPGRIESGMLAGPITYDTVQGGEVTVTREGGGVTVSDADGGTANVITADVNVSNGVIHVIDRVLMPADSAATQP